MSRARAIETRLEKLLPSLEEYFTSGFLTRAETQEVARQRTHWEYRLIAKPLLFLDVRNAIAYELNLEKRLREYCVSTKLELKHRWAILERIETIYKIGLKHLRICGEWEQLRVAYVLFLREHSRHSSLSALYGELLTAHPTRGPLWAEAIHYEGIILSNTDNARAIAQQALATAGTQIEVWDAAFRLELHFADRLLARLAEEQTNNPQNANVAAALRTENAALASLVLDASLAEAVAREGIFGAAGGAALARLFLTSAAAFAYTRPLAEKIIKMSATHALARGWPEAAAAAFVRDFVLFDVSLAERGPRAMGAAEFLQNPQELLRRRTASPEEMHVARAQSVAAAILCAENTQIPLKLRRAAAECAVEVLEQMRSRAARAVPAVAAALLSKCAPAAVEAFHMLHQNTERKIKQTDDVAAEEIKRTCTRVRAVFEAVAEKESEEQKRDDATASNREKRRRVETEESIWPRDRLAALGDAAGAHADDALLRALREGKETNVETILQPLGGIANIRCGPNAPVTLWRVFEFLERRGDSIPSTVSSPTKKNRKDDHKKEEENKNNNKNGKRSLNNKRAAEEDSDSDSEDEDLENIQKKENALDSYAVAGLRFLATVPCAAAHDSTSDKNKMKIEDENEKERLDGCWNLVAARIYSVTGLALSRDTTRADFSAAIRRAGPNTAKSLFCLFSALRKCPPSRAVLAAAVAPMLEAMAVVFSEKEKETHSAALREARAVHEAVLALYAAAQNPQRTLCIVRPPPQITLGRSGSGNCVELNAAELNAADWAAFVVFERDVARDLRRARETAARARRVAINPQLLLTTLGSQ